MANDTRQAPRRCPRKFLTLSVPILSALAVTALTALIPQSVPAQNSPPEEAEIIHKIDAAVFERSRQISSYSVQEQYSIYRNGEANPSAQETVETSYSQQTGKQYNPIAQSGSSLLRSNIIDRILAGEKEMARPDTRESVWVTSTNYDMHLEPASTSAPVSMNGHTCLIIDLTPKRKSQHLFNGKAWVDASDFTVVRLEGVPSESPSFFAGNTTVVRDYEKVDGYSMATHAEAHSHSFLLGNTVLKIDYTSYKIERNTAKPD